MQAVLVFALCLVAVQSEPADVIRQKFVPVPKVAVHEEAIVHNKPVHVKSQHPHVVKVPKPMVQEVPHFIERTVVITKDIPERQFYPVPQHNFVVRQEFRPRPFDAPFQVPQPIIQNVPQEKVVEVPVQVPRVRVVKVPRTQVVEVPTPVERVEVVNVPEVKRVPQFIRKDIKVPFKVDVPIKRTVKVPRVRTVEVPAPFKVTRKVPQIIKQRVHVPEYFPVVKRISHPFPVKKNVPVFLRRQVAQRVPFPVNIGRIFVSRFFGNRQHLAIARAQGFIPHGARGTVIETSGPLVSGTTVGSTGFVGESLQETAIPLTGEPIGSSGESSSFISEGFASVPELSGSSGASTSFISEGIAPGSEPSDIGGETFIEPFGETAFVDGPANSFAVSETNGGSNGESAGGENGGAGGSEFGNGNNGGRNGVNGGDQGGNGDFGGNSEFATNGDFGGNGEFATNGDFGGNGEFTGNSDNGNGADTGSFGIGVSEASGSAGSASSTAEGLGSETVGSAGSSTFNSENFILSTGSSGGSSSSGSGGYTKDRYNTGYVKYASKNLKKQGVSKW